MASAQTTLAKWTFETSLPSGGGPLAAEEGSGSANSNTGGTFTNPAGWGSAESWSSNGWAAGEYFQFEASSTSYSGISVAWNQTGSNTGPKNFKLEYSTDGSAFTSFQTYSLTNQTWGATNFPVPSVFSADLSSIASLNNAANIYFRLTVVDTEAISSTSPVASAGTGRVDNFTITAAPPPGSPIITPGASLLSGFSTFGGFSSVSQSFTATGVDLTTTMTLTAPAGYEVSSDNAVFGPTASLAAEGGTGYVRLSASAPVGAANGSITLSSTGATDKFIVLTGIVNNPNTFTVSFAPSFIAENSSTPAVGTVSVPVAPTSNLSVSLTSNDTSVVTVPLSVTIPAGEFSATFDATPVAENNSLVTRIATVEATASGYTMGSAILNVTNVDPNPDASISIASVGGANSQNFDALGTMAFASVISSVSGTTTNLGGLESSLKGWYAGKIAGTGTSSTSISPDTGTGNSGAVVNYGADAGTDRALGVLASGANTMGIGAIFKNDTASTLTGLTLSVTAEFWRTSTSTTNSLTFGYGKMGGAITEDTFISTTDSGVLPLTGANIAGPAFVPVSNGALDGNVSPNRAFVNVSLPITILPGELVFIRWQDSNETGDDAGLAIDDVTVVGVGTSSGNAYSDWATANSAGGGTGGDHDSDGVSNGVEFFMGETGSGFTSLPAPDANRLISFPVSSSATGATGIIQTSPDLVVWTTLASSTSGGFISATIPAAGPTGKIFARLSVVVTP